MGYVLGLHVGDDFKIVLKWSGLLEVEGSKVFRKAGNHNLYTVLYPETLETTAWTTTTTQCYIPKYLKPQDEPQSLHSVTSRNAWNHSMNHNHCTVLHPEIFETTAWTTTTTPCYIPKRLKPQRKPQPLHRVTSRNIWNHSVNHNHYIVSHPETLETPVWTTTTT